MSHGRSARRAVGGNTTSVEVRGRIVGGFGIGPRDDSIEGTASGDDDSGVELGKTAEAKASDTRAGKSGQRRGTLSIRVSTVVVGAVIAALVIAVAVLGGLLVSARGDLADRNDREAADKRAEQVATEYAVGAATVNYQDITSWVAELKANTVPQLANKFDATAPKLEQIWFR
ncbi:hypothetical protein [Nocardia sp. CA-120079]|uniref:hypothetical protein n=1 Tax=Nocardia sp. CA-120079 TaxID=3239974 RepID=UPI003D976ABE